VSKFFNDFVVGIDVSSEFSVVAMLEPSGSLIRKPFRIDHNPKGFNKLLEILKKEEERLKQKPIYFVESTGIFHLPLFFFLRSNDLKGWSALRWTASGCYTAHGFTPEAEGAAFG
jgi:hypothetical protein